jgi:hypothetical protein
LTDDYQTFFAEYQEKLGQDFEGALLWRQLLSFRWLNSSLAVRSLAEVMAERLLGPATLGDLAQREARGDSPRLIINTTLYNSGWRFVITTLPPEASRDDFYADLRAALGRRGQTTAFPPAFLQCWEKLLSITPTERRVPHARAAPKRADPPLQHGWSVSRGLTWRTRAVIAEIHVIMIYIDDSETRQQEFGWPQRGRLCDSGFEGVVS